MARAVVSANFKWRLTQPPFHFPWWHTTCTPLPSAPPLSDSVPQAKHISHERSSGQASPRALHLNTDITPMELHREKYLQSINGTCTSWYEPVLVGTLGMLNHYSNSFQVASQSLEWFFYALLCPCCAMMSGIPLVCSKIWNNSNCFLLSAALYSVLPLLLR